MSWWQDNSLTYQPNFPTSQPHMFTLVYFFIFLPPKSSITHYHLLPLYHPVLLSFKSYYIQSFNLSKFKLFSFFSFLSSSWHKTWWFSHKLTLSQVFNLSKDKFWVHLIRWCKLYITNYFCTCHVILCHVNSDF